MKNIIRTITFCAALTLISCGGDGSGGSGGSVVTIDGNCIPNADELEMLTLHNTARASSRSCGSNKREAAPALEWHCVLAQVAKNHSQDMGEVNFFAHTGSDGLSPFDRMKNAGYQFRIAGENIVAGGDSNSSMMNRWLNSEGHCNNIMNPNLTQMGAGLDEPSAARHKRYWTAVFGKPL